MNFLHLPAPAGARTVAYFHGNAETISLQNGAVAALSEAKLGGVFVEYRGYELSAQSKPNEQGIYLDAETVLDLLATEGVDPRQVVLVGFSLGGGVASEMARRGRGGALLLVSSFPSMPALVGRWVPWLPVSLVVRERFDTFGRAKQLHVPTLLVHGENDTLVPLAMARTLADAIPGARLVVVADAGHNNVFEHNRELPRFILDLVSEGAR